MAASAVSYPLSPRELARLSMSSISSAGSMVSGTNYTSSSSSSSSSSASPSSTSSPPQISIAHHMGEVAPKIEDPGDEGALKNIPPLHPHALPGEPKRGRGRPRKHPLVPVGAVQKVTKGRSKTGCITCRRRKKKCDEERPECWLPLLPPLPGLHVFFKFSSGEDITLIDLLPLSPPSHVSRVGKNCKKNAVVCEGYREVTVWQSGRQRAEGECRSTWIFLVPENEVFY